MHTPSVGIVDAEVAVLSPDRLRRERLRLIVDTGSVLTWLPRRLLTELGITPIRTRTFRTIDGWTPPREVGEATIVWEGLAGTVPVVFGWENDVSVLGVTALEILGLQVNPSTGRLEREDVTLALAGAYASRGSVITP